MKHSTKSRLTSQQDSGWRNNSDNNSQGGTDLNFSPNYSEVEAPLGPASRVDLANHDKNLSSAGTIQFMPKKDSFQCLRTISQ
jgi:hypothetical protein